jgi:alginate O-acetyltransferase complex protein AlgI
VDVYQRRIPAEKSLANLGLFILFFLHLVAGPIVRARDFLPQITRPKRWSWLRAQLGVQYFLMGLFKKLVIADRMALFVDPVFANPEAYRTSAVWLAMFAYAFQVYCDFSGYTDMALGSAHLLGYKLALNFNMPFLARNFAEFWKRWHMSLSGWLRDYLFFPLGGSRGGRWLVYRNLLITFTICGLWHGAAWNFVLWGLATGVILCLHREWQSFCKGAAGLERALQSLPGTIVSIAATFLCFCLTLIIFRAESLAGMGTLFARLFTPQAGLGSPMHPTGFVMALAFMTLGHALGWAGADRLLLKRLPAPALSAAYSLTLCAALLLAPDTNKAFIYFQF